MWQSFFIPKKSNTEVKKDMEGQFFLLAMKISLSNKAGR
jgi:hypothetical protein